MTTVERHYEDLLAPVYLWMAGGIEHALATGESDIQEFATPAGLAIDLGAGFGMHAIPLARRGWRVLAIDSSPFLLDQLRKHAGELPISVARDDLGCFAAHLDAERKADLVLCMGDTVTHLPSTDALDQLARTVAQHLDPDGIFVLTFRDYTILPTGPARFIPVRSDAQRIHTCLLEEAGGKVRVTDILHQQTTKTTETASQWKMTVSEYEKLRIAPESLCSILRQSGFDVQHANGPRGMVKVIARPARV